MGRRCQCEKLLEMLENDWRLRIVGRETAMVWLELTRFIYRFGDDLILRLDTRSGSAIGSLAELAFALRIDETQLETHLETLFQRRLLLKAPCGGVALPPELGLTARQRAARLNGAKGGRPRKDSQPPEQRSLLLPLPGSPSAKPAETQQRTQMAKPAATTPTTTTTTTTTTTDSQDSNETIAVSRSDPPPAWLALGAELAALAGHRRSPHTQDLATVRAWLDAGATRDLLLDVFRSVLGRQKCPQTPALSYFDGAVRDALVRAPAAEQVATAAALSTEDAALRRRLVGVSTMRGRHGSAPLGPTWSAFKAVMAQGDDAVAAATAWLDVMERWETHGFSGRTPPEFAAYVAEASDNGSHRSARRASG